MTPPARSSQFVVLWLGALLLGLALGACDDPSVLTADMPLHLEDHLDVAVIEGSELPENPAATAVWHFDEPQPEWRAIVDTLATSAARVERTTDALGVALGERTAGQFGGGIYVELPDWHEDTWSHVIVRARTSSVRNIGIFVNRVELAPGEPLVPPMGVLGSSPLASDGLVHTYQIPLRAPEGLGMIPWQRLGLWAGADEPGTLDILSVTVVPATWIYTEGFGMHSISIESFLRRSLFTHAPGRVSYRVQVPEGGRFATALGVLGAESPVEFRVVAEPEGGEPVTLLSETYADEDRWAERAVDLSEFVGQTLTLSLEADAAEPGTVAIWGAPTLSGSRGADKPNVILYIIDGGWADDMSVYGYNRRTTPYLERLAAEGAVFEHAYSNASATSQSTPSFMTSLPFSALGIADDYDALPVEALTMAERLHGAGYVTAVFTSNPNAGAPSGLDRGVDLMRDDFVRRDYTSSVELHESYWDWRDAFPAEPYWAHFQTTDVHEYEGGRLTPVPPFSGMFVTAARRREYYQERDRAPAGGGDAPRGASGTIEKGRRMEAAGIDRVGFYETMRGLYDESLAHQDYQIGQLVERLRGRGEWESTLLIVAADHAIEAALTDLGALLQDTLPPQWTRSSVRGSITRVPLIFVWPGHIRGGQRFDAPVSMIDVLPTVLDLVGLPRPEVAQGQSLAPLLRREPGWTPRPVIFDDGSWRSSTGELQSRPDMIDGRWGASMEIGAPPDDPGARRPWPVLLFDVWADPWALRPINEERPDLVEKYTTLLEEQLKAHQALAARFTPGAELALTPEQLERLRTLGYVR